MFHVNWSWSSGLVSDRGCQKIRWPFLQQKPNDVMFLRRWRGLSEMKRDPEESCHNPDTYSIHTERAVKWLIAISFVRNCKLLPKIAWRAYLYALCNIPETSWCHRHYSLTAFNCLNTILGVLFLSVRSDLANHVTKAATKVGIIFKESVYSVYSV